VGGLKGEGILEGASAGATSSAPTPVHFLLLLPLFSAAPPVVPAPAPPVVNIDPPAPAARDKLKQVLEQVNWSKSIGALPQRQDGADHVDESDGPKAPHYE
jgi:hypothetical protein